MLSILFPIPLESFSRPFSTHKPKKNQPFLRVSTPKCSFEVKVIPPLSV